MKVHEDYRQYSAPPWVRPSVERLLSTLPPGYLAGLEALVLTDSSTISKGKTRRVNGRKYLARECRGFYFPRTPERAAFITIAVDNVIWHRMRGVPLDSLRDALLGEVVYHEVGHHLDVTLGAAARSGEAAADDWSSRLTEIHLRKMYPLTTRVLSAGAWLLGPLIDWFLKRRLRRRDIRA